ncbi:YidB family protein [Streptomyces marianii]|uniref:YidB family protein n=1 Tax=Streptomyces marianii TaxID=1817406 RepID=UPI001486D324|nr:YidB family protein [Streptomyces marianii]
MAGNDLGGLLGGPLGGGQGGSSGGNILGALIGALAGGGEAGAAGPTGAAAGWADGNPLGALLDVLAGAGLADQARSWIGTGQNQQVSGGQIAQALPKETLDKVARDTGVTPRQAADRIARSLPQAVDRPTPSGQLPQSASLDEIIRKQRIRRGGAPRRPAAAAPRVSRAGRHGPASGRLTGAEPAGVRPGRPCPARH